MNEPTTPTAPAVTAPTSTPEPHPKASVSTSEAEQMMEWLKQDQAQGRISPEQAQKAFDQLNASPEQRLPDPCTDEQKALDAAFPPAKPADYTIQYFRPGEPGEVTKDMQAFEANARGWLSGAGFPRALGNSLVTQITRVLQTTKDMTPEQLDTSGETEYAKLQKVHGDKLDERLRQAGLMVHDLDLKKPGLKNLLKSRGIGDNALVANMLIQHAAIYHARRAR
jgi:hypothetical protein